MHLLARRFIAGLRTRAVHGSLLLGLLLATPLAGQTPRPESPTTEERVVSSFLLNCLYYGQWPAAFDWQSNKVARIGILGKNLLGDTLRTVADDFQGRRFPEGQILITNSLNPADLVDCHVIYVVESGAPPVAKVIEAFAGRPVILVSASKGFVDLGGTLELHLEPGKPPRWDLNMDQLSASRVLLGSPMKARASLLIENGRRILNKPR